MKEFGKRRRGDDHREVPLERTPLGGEARIMLDQKTQEFGVSAIMAFANFADERRAYR